MKNMKKKCLFTWMLFMIMFITGACGIGTDTTVENVTETEAEDPNTAIKEENLAESKGNGEADLNGEECIQEEDVIFYDDFMGNEADIVLLMDESGSMAHSDKEEIAVEAAQLFIDMERVAGVNISLIEFSDEIKATDLVKMEQIGDKDLFKKILRAVTYGGSAHTDTGAALKKAVEILNASETTGKKAIILFTDGRTDIDEDTPGRTTEDSLEDVNEAMLEAAKRGYSIYSVGLNADGSVDEDALSMLASNTGGDYRIATDVRELPAFFNQIFMEMRSIREIELGEFEADGKFHDVEIKIESNYVLEANIVILSSNKVEYHLYNPQGDEVTEKDEGVMFSSEEKYTLLKLIRPQADTWKMKVKGVTGDNIQVSLLYNYDMSMITELPSRNIRIGDSLPVDVYLSISGARITDKEFYDTIRVEASIKNMENEEETLVEFSSSENGFHGSFTPETVGDYSLDILLEGDGFYRDGDSIPVKVFPIGLTLVKEFTVLEVVKGQQISVDLGEYITGQQKIKYNIINTPDIAECEIEDDKFLIIRGMEAGEAVLELEAAGEADGSREVIPIKIRCLEEIGDTVSPEDVWGTARWWLIGLGGIILILAACITAIQRNQRKIQGTFRLEVSRNLNSESGAIEKRDYSISTPIHGRNLNTNKLSLGDLLRNYQKYYESVERNDGKKKELDGVLAAAAPYTKKVLIKGGKQSGHIRVESKAANAVKLYSMQGIQQENRVEINAGVSNSSPYQRSQGCKIRIAVVEGYLEIVITYKMMNI